MWAIRVAVRDMANNKNDAVFLISCPDRKGIIAATSSFFFERGFNIIHCQQHTDPREGRFFMRVLIDLNSAPIARARLLEDFSSVASGFSMQWSAHFCADAIKVAVLCTQEPHCLFDLLCRVHNDEFASGEIQSTRS